MEKILHEDLKLGGRITYYEEKNLVYADSWGDHSAEVPYKAYFEMFLKTFPYATCSHLIIDTTKLTKSTGSNRAWFSTNVAPRFFKAYPDTSIVRIAIIVPKSLFEKLAVDILTKAAHMMGNKAQIKTFNTMEEAEAFVSAS